MSITRCMSIPLRRKLVALQPEQWVEALPGYWKKNPRAGYIARIIVSCPEWADRARLREMAREATRMTLLRGERYVLGHVFPVTSDWVCGLTTPDNIKIIHWRENARAGNKFHEALQITMFDEPEQLRLI